MVMIVGNGDVDEKEHPVRQTRRWWPRSRSHMCVCECVCLFDGKTENGSKMTCAMLTKIYQLTQKSNLFLSGLIWQCFIIPR